MYIMDGPFYTIRCGPCWVKNVFEHGQNAQIWHSSRACTMSYLGICSPLIHSIVSNNSTSGQWRPWSDCADAQADLGLRCPHMPKDMFTHGAIHTGEQWTAWTYLRNGNGVETTFPPISVAFYLLTPCKLQIWNELKLASVLKIWNERILAPILKTPASLNLWILLNAVS